MGKKKNRKPVSGWADTKWFPHKQHPANWKKKKAIDKNVTYMTFTHSPVVEFNLSDKGVKAMIKKLPAERVVYGKNGKVFVTTIPLTDNVSKKERADNKASGKKQGENISYAYPMVYSGIRDALGKNNSDYSPVPADKVIINNLFSDLPVVDVPITGGKGHFKNKQVKKKQGNKKSPK